MSLYHSVVGPDLLLVFVWRSKSACRHPPRRTADQIHLAWMIIFDEMKIMVGKLCHCSDGVKDVLRSGQRV